MQSRLDLLNTKCLQKRIPHSFSILLPFQLKIKMTPLRSSYSKLFLQVFKSQLAFPNLIKILEISMNKLKITLFQNNFWPFTVQINCSVSDLNFFANYLAFSLVFQKFFLKQVSIIFKTKYHLLYEKFDHSYLYFQLNTVPLILIYFLALMINLLFLRCFCKCCCGCGRRK